MKRINERKDILYFRTSHSTFGSSMSVTLKMNYRYMYGISCWSNAIWKYLFHHRKCLSSLRCPFHRWLLLWSSLASLLSHRNTTPRWMRARTIAARRRRREIKTTMKTITLCCCLFISNLHHIKIVFGYFCCFVSFGFILAAQKLHVPPFVFGKRSKIFCTYFCGILFKREQRLVLQTTFTHYHFCHRSLVGYIDFESIQWNAWKAKGIRICGYH